jgi:hypothetical protein
VDNLDDAVRATEAATRLDRRRVRRRFEERFSVERMARDYVAVYKRLARVAPAAESMEVSYG